MIYIISKMTWPEPQDNQSSIDLVGQNMQLMSLIPSRLIYEVKSGCTRLGPFSINITEIRLRVSEFYLIAHKIVINMGIVNP